MTKKEVDKERRAILVILAGGQSLEDLIDQLHGWDILNDDYEAMTLEQQVFVRAGYK